MLRKKIESYEEVKISEELRNKCIEYLKDNPLEIYWDYRDQLSLEQVKKLMESKEALSDIENELWEYNSHYIWELETRLIEEMKKEFPELEKIETCDLRDEFLDYLGVDLNIKELIRHTPDVRVRVVIHSNYEGVGYQDRGRGDFRGNEYIKEIKKLLKGKYDKVSFQQELDNICSSVNQFIFYFKTNVENLIGIKKRFKNSIVIPKDAMAGFFDSWNGSGSILEVKLLKDIKLKKQYGATKYDTISVVLDEACDYSVEKVYGLCGVPDIDIIVK